MHTRFNNPRLFRIQLKYYTVYNSLLTIGISSQIEYVVSVWYSYLIVMRGLWSREQEVLGLTNRLLSFHYILRI
jgi:hypothetical protein